MKSVLINGRWEIILPDHRADRPEWLIENGGWEKARLDSMYETIKPGDIVYYVGAEEGDMCGLLAMWGAKLVMFEPNARVMPNIRAIWEANKLGPAVVLPAFAANETVNHFDWYTTSFIEGDVIPDHGFKELRDPGEIPRIKIDNMVFNPSFWNRQPVRMPDVISLDVEGSEWEVLRGAERTLREYHPRIYLSLHPEFLHEQYGEWGAELRKWIIDLGYKETLLDYPLHEVHLYYES